MPFGINKAALFGAAGSSGEAGWVVQPYSDTTGSSPSYWMYDMAVASDDSVWATSLTNFSNNGVIFHIESDGTLGAANDQKVMDPTQSGSYGGRGLAIAANGDLIAMGGGPINDGSARTGILTSAHTPGTLVQDWDKSLFHPIVTPMYAYQTPLTTKGTKGYGAVYYYDGSTKYDTLMFKISLTDGSEEALNGSSDCLHLYGSSYVSTYPSSACVSTDGSGDDWFYIQYKNGGNGCGVQGVEIGTTTYMARFYFPSSGTGAASGGLCTADADNLYFTFGDGTNLKFHLLKIAKSNGNIQWQRKITVDSSTAGFDYIPPPVVDSSGNVYVVFNTRDTQQFSSANNGSVHWAKYDSSGNIQTLDGTTLKTLTTPTASQVVYPMRAELSSDDSFLYITGALGSGSRPFVAKLPTDGTGTDNSTALSGNFPGDDLYYKNNWTHTDAAGDATQSTLGSQSTGNISSFGNQLEDCVAQANPGIYLDEVG